MLWNSAVSGTGSGPSCLASRDGAAKVASHCASFQCSTAHAFICSSEFLSIDLSPVAHLCLNNSGLCKKNNIFFSLCPMRRRKIKISFAVLLSCILPCCIRFELLATSFLLRPDGLQLCFG